MIIGIVVALAEELGTLTFNKVGKGSFCQLTDNIIIAYAGVGPENARHAAELLIANGAQRLVSWGCAAALSPDLKPGDCLLPENLLAENQATLCCDKNWIATVRQLLTDEIPIRTGHLVHSHCLVTTSQKKQAIHSATGAVAVDMESYSIAKIAEQAEMPCLVIRVIADSVSLSLPKAISFAMNADGEIERGKIFSYILLHPSEIPDLIKLGKSFSCATKTLKSIAPYLDKITH